MATHQLTQQGANATSPAAGGGWVWFRRLRRLPPRALAACALLAAAAAVPAVAVMFGAFTEPWPPAVADAVLVAATCLALAGVTAFEPPRSASPLAYARQLRARFLELQSTFDADDRRRPGEGKEKEDDRVPSDP